MTSRRYYCINCEREVDVDDVIQYYDSGTGYLELNCPYCKDDMLEYAYECESCGKVVPHSLVTNGVCDNCLISEAENVRQVIEFGAEDTDNGEVTINALWAYVYTPDEINDILTADFMNLPEAKQKEFARKYATEDRYNFADWLKVRSQE